LGERGNSMEKTLDCAMRSGYVFWLAVSPNDPKETRRIIIATQCSVGTFLLRIC